MAQQRQRASRDALSLLRRAVVALILVASIAGLVSLARRATSQAEQATELGSVVPEYRPAAKASTWFCPGVPGSDDSISGLLVISNSGESPVGGTITRFALDGAARRQRFAVPARSTLEVDALVGTQSQFVSALVESQGAPIAVEQRTAHRAGNAVASCASSPAGSWYLADGFTGADSVEQVVVTNPSLDSAILDVSFVTSIGERSPQSLKGVVIPPESVRVFDLAALDARNEATIAVSVKATVGRVVVGRSQHYLGRGRLGYTMMLAASGMSDRWYFADGEKDETVNEEFVIFNPLSNDQQLTFIITRDDGVPLDPLVVTAPAKRVTKFAPTTLGTLTPGRYSAVVTATSASSSASSSVGVVVERVSTRQNDKSTASAVLLGAPSPSRSWIAPSGTTPDVPASLRIFNPGSAAATFSVTYLGPAGDVTVPGYEQVSLAPGAGASITLAAQVAAATVSVTASEPVVVQRSVPRGSKQPIDGVAPLVPVAAADTREGCPSSENC
ncbi:MAG: DUF5719 family protein [Ilumatobacteraceae bacterium]